MLLSLLKSSFALKQVHQIQAQTLIHGLNMQNQTLAKVIELNHIDYARVIFDQILTPTDFSWNSLIRAYAHNKSPHESLLIFVRMIRNDVKPSNFTYPFVINACSARIMISEGEQIHCHVVKLGFRSDVYVSNSLIDMYFKYCCVESAVHVWDEMEARDEVSWNSIVNGYVQCGQIENARELFDEMPMRKNVVSWTSLINGYGKRGKLVEMLDLFCKMLISVDEIKPNAMTMVCLLSCCSNLSNFEFGKWVAIFINVNKIPLNVFLCTAIIDMYSKCGEMKKAQRVFDGTLTVYKSCAIWNAMLTGYVHHGLLEEALNMYSRMQVELVKPDEMTMVNVLSACAGLGALKLGKEVHCYLGRNGLELNVIIATSLVEMYSKCGEIAEGCLVFVKTSYKDIALWNAMILGLAHNGRGEDALIVFTQMERVGERPNDVTFIGVLSACNHSGLVEEGRSHFSNMIAKHGLCPEIEHYACMVDLLGRAGHLNEAYELVKNMVDLPDSILWGALLNACRVHQNLELADKVGQIIISPGKPNFGLCILLSNIYASVGRWKDVTRMRFIKEGGTKKPLGCSWIEVDAGVHRFIVDDTSHEKSDEIYEIYYSLVNLMKVENYWIFQNWITLQQNSL